MHKDDPHSNLSPVEKTDSSVMQPNSVTVDFDTDAGHQGIFSGEDTRVETENLPTVPEVVQQAPASSISPTLRTTSTVTGDLQLGGATKKKKWPLFVALGAVAVVVAAIFIVKIIPTMTSDPSSANHTKYIESYNKFANYLLSGRTETSTGEDISTSNGIAAKALRERNSTFFDEASRLYSIFLDEYNSDISALNAALPIYTNLSIVSAYSRAKFLDVNTIMAYYAENGIDATNAANAELLNELRSSTSTSAYSDEIYNNAKEYLDAEMELLKLVDGNGCFEGRVIDSACIATVQVPANLQSRITSANSALSSIDQIVSDALNNLISSVITVKESLR